MAELTQLQGSCAFDTTLSEEIDKVFQPQWSLLTQSSSSAHVCTECKQRLSLQSRLVSANVGGFLVTLKGACDLDVQDTRLFHNVLLNPSHPVRVFPAKLRPTCCCNSKPLLKFEGECHPSELLLKHRSFQYANRKATGCSLTWWKEHPFILHDEGIIIWYGVPLRKVPSSLLGWVSSQAWSTKASKLLASNVKQLGRYECSEDFIRRAARPTLLGLAIVSLAFLLAHRQKKCVDLYCEVDSSSKMREESAGLTESMEHYFKMSDHPRRPNYRESGCLAMQSNVAPAVANKTRGVHRACDGSAKNFPAIPPSGSTMALQTEAQMPHTPPTIWWIMMSGIHLRHGLLALPTLRLQLACAASSWFSCYKHHAMKSVKQLKHIFLESHLATA